jgi:hypothetical protein
LPGITLLTEFGGMRAHHVELRAQHLDFEV